MKCLYACNQPGPAIEAIPAIWTVFVFSAIVAFGIYLCFSVPDIKTERQLRRERLNAQPSRRPGWSLEDNRARVLAHHEKEAREARRAELEAVASEFNVDAADVCEHEQELVA